MSTRVYVKFSERQALLVRELLTDATDELDDERLIAGARKALDRALIQYGTHNTALALLAEREGR